MLICQRSWIWPPGYRVDCHTLRKLAGSIHLYQDQPKDWTSQHHPSASQRCVSRIGFNLNHAFIELTLSLTNSGNLQGNQYGLGIADLACQADEAQGSTACFAANTEIIPGPETGA